MFSNPTAVTFIGYLIVMVGVGVFAYYYTRSYTDFILGGRSLGGFVTALSVGASDMSGWLLMGLPGAVFLFGVSLDGVYQPTVLAVKSDKHLVNQIREYVPQGTVYSYDGMSFYCANFYMNDQMRHFEKDLPSGEGYVVLPERGKELLFEEFGNTYDFEEIFLTKKRSCDLRDEIYMYKFKKK